MKPLRMKGVLALIVGLQWGCAANVEAPVLDFETPTEFAAAPSSAVMPSPTEAWWESFESPELDQVVEAALANNPSLLVASANLESALARGRIEGAALKPQASVGLNGSKRKQNFIGFPIPGAEDSVLSTTATTTGLSLNVSWEADLWGRLRAQKAAAYADAAAAQEDLEAARLSIAGQAAKAWLALVEAEQQVLLAEDTLDSRRRTEQRITNRYRRGLSQPLDVRLTKTQTSAVEAQLAQRRQALDSARRQLEVLTGVYPSGALRAGVDLPTLPARPATGVPVTLISRRPDLRAAERRAFAASARLRAAQRALYPSFSLTGSTGTSAGSELENLLDGDFSVWSIAANLLQPLFQGGRLRAGVDLAEAGLSGAEASWLQNSLSAFVEAETSMASETLLGDQVTALAESSAQSDAAEELAQGRYNRGLTDFLTVLESQRTAFQSRSQLLSVRRQQLSARVDLILALGGSPTPSTGTCPSPDPKTSPSNSSPASDSQ